MAEPHTAQTIDSLGNRGGINHPPMQNPVKIGQKTLKFFTTQPSTGPKSDPCPPRGGGVQPTHLPTLKPPGGGVTQVVISELTLKTEHSHRSGRLGGGGAQQEGDRKAEFSQPQGILGRQALKPLHL